MSMKKALLTILIFSIFVIGALIQKSLLEPVRGQAMAMPFITSFATTFILISIYSISIFCHKQLSTILHIYFVISVQLILIGYTIYKYIFYWNLMEGNIPKDEWDSDYFPPTYLNYYIIAFFSIAIIGLCFRTLKIRANKKLMTAIMLLISTINFAQNKTAYSKDKTEFYITKTENINGCRKEVSWRCYNSKTKEIKRESIRDFATDSNQTCDFSAYIVTKKEYREGKLFEVKQYFAGSEQSDEEACGIWKFYNNEGELFDSKKYGECDVLKFSKQ
ncbi:glucan phosphoethanolaminetransferase (alkaline phosphatase superfamily) [Flavobacterium sp. 7E]|uniref:hypothetical protein n=1 Tax=Flavobacterium sp. 7E TaxID=2735898 RepID=UPI001570E5EF|nr:hypothetical protein [Flavobacterium sp. 7E]NRS90371.1 glucan phosphoethanolaminetransferase (alkaline phosphatase superfamily) [Flavobacterium sp. 7E]